RPGWERSRAPARLAARGGPLPRAAARALQREPELGAVGARCRAAGDLFGADDECGAEWLPGPDAHLHRRRGAPPRLPGARYAAGVHRAARARRLALRVSHRQALERARTRARRSRDAPFRRVPATFRRTPARRHAIRTCP